MRNSEVSQKMPWAILRITIGLAALPLVLLGGLLVDFADISATVKVAIIVICAACWTLVALLLRHYGKWPFGEKDITRPH